MAEKCLDAPGAFGISQRHEHPVHEDDRQKSRRRWQETSQKKVLCEMKDLEKRIAAHARAHVTILKMILTGVIARVTGIDKYSPAIQPRRLTD